jgi:hypothetical protein
MGGWLMEEGREEASVDSQWKRAKKSREKREPLSLDFLLSKKP